MASSIKTSVKMIATLRDWCWISLKIRLFPEAFLCPKLGNYLLQIQGVSEMLWCIKLSYFADNRWCPNINGVRKYMVNTVVCIISLAVSPDKVLYNQSIDIFHTSL